MLFHIEHLTIKKIGDFVLSYNQFKKLKKKKLQSRYKN